MILDAFWVFVQINFWIAVIWVLAAGVTWLIERYDLDL